MSVNLKSHLKKLARITREDGILTALDYDYQVTRNENLLLNGLFGRLEYLKGPIVSWNGKGEREHTAKHYVAVYRDFANGTLLDVLNLK